MNIYELVQTNKLAEAIQLLIDNNISEAFLLSGRFNRNNKDRRCGIIDNEKYSTELNKITYAILDLSKELGSASPSFDAPKKAIINFNESALLSIAKDNKRRRPSIAAEAKDILDLYRTYNDTKAIRATFDPTGRKLAIIISDANELINKLKLEKEDSLIDIIEQIELLLDMAIPTYLSLSKAYKLASGRGLKSEYIERQLISKPNDDEVKISIAEEIEEYTLSITPK